MLNTYCFLMTHDTDFFLVCSTSNKQTISISRVQTNLLGHQDLSETDILTVDKISAEEWRKGPLILGGPYVFSRADFNLRHHINRKI